MKCKFFIFLFLILHVFSCEDDSEFTCNQQTGITKFEFKAKDNPEVLTGDVVAEIIDDNIIVRIPYLVPNKQLKPQITYEGKSIYIENSNNEYIDFSNPIKCTVLDNDGNKMVYTITVTAFTGLPIMYLETDGRAEIESKTEYLNATVAIKGGGEFARSSKWDLDKTKVRIKGRGNSSWVQPKKPYKLKFDSKISLLGEPADKEWVLLANFSDKTCLRNSTAFFMGESMTDLDWTPRSHFIELVLNGKYVGTYLLTEQIKISGHRVDVTDNGYLLEVDQAGRLDPDDVFFRTNKILLCIKDTEIQQGSAEYNWIKNYITNLENVLYSEYFLDKEKGYAQYIDMQSFVDWYLVQEISKNNDGIFWSSCYMNIAPGGKLKMGPLWDFDIAFGNVNFGVCMNPTGFYIKDKSVWIERMCKDPEFMKLVRKRFDEIYKNRDQIYSFINSQAEYLKYSIIENNAVWKNLYDYTWPNYNIWGNYENEVQALKYFLSERLNWLNNNLPK